MTRKQKQNNHLKIMIHVITVNFIFFAICDELHILSKVVWKIKQLSKRIRNVQVLPLQEKSW